jgi:hypothetical protein
MKYAFKEITVRLEQLFLLLILLHYNLQIYYLAFGAGTGFLEIVKHCDYFGACLPAQVLNYMGF